MNATQTFQLAALIAGMASFAVAVLWRLTGTNQGDKIQHYCAGASVACALLAWFFFLLSVIVKATP